MGKKNKNKTTRDVDFYSPDKNLRKTLDYFDVKGAGGGGMPSARNSSGSSQYRSADDVKADLKKAKASHYAFNRGIEAAAMSGDKKSKSLMKSGMGNVGGIMRGVKHLGKLKKDNFGGGGMNGGENQSVLAYDLVNLDRENQTEGYRDMFASKDALEDLKNKLAKGGEVDEKFQPDKSEQTLKDEAIVDYWDENFATGGIYGDESNKGPAMSQVYKDYGSPMLEPMMQQRETEEQNSATKFLDAYKKDLFQGGSALMPDIY